MYPSIEMTFPGSLQDVRLFVAAYEERSFTAAATRETSTQSGVSHHMRQLEDALGVKLFIRDKSGVVATPAADVFYNYCVDVLRGLDEATDRLARFQPGHQSAFAVGLIPALANRIGVPALLRFSEKNPNVRVKMVESYSSSIGDLVASGALDFAVSPLHGHETGVRGRPLTTAPECLIARAGSRKKRPFNMVWASKMPGRRAAIRAALDANGIRIDRELEIDSGLATLDLVARSDWKTVTPAFMLDPEVDADRFDIRPLRNPDLPFTISLLERSRTKLRPEAEEFVALLVEEADRATKIWLKKFGM